MTPDRHLGAAWIDRCQPDLLITESTYAATVRLGVVGGVGGVYNEEVGLVDEVGEA